LRKLEGVEEKGEKRYLSLRETGKKEKGGDRGRERGKSENPRTRSPSEGKKDFFPDRS
jgi:hypothetical protein